MVNVQQQWRRVAHQLNARMAQIPIDQAELARKANVSDATIRGLMSGKPRAANPRSGPLRKVAAAVGWTPDSIERILAGEEPLEANGTPADTELAVRLERVERLQAAFASRLSDMAETLDDLAEMSHTHAGRRRGEETSSAL